MDIYIHIKNKKGEVFRVVNLGGEKHLEFFKKHLKEKYINKIEFPIFFNELTIGNYLDVGKIKKLKEEIKNIGILIGDDLKEYKELLAKRNRIESNILDCSSLKNLLTIGINRLSELADEIDKSEFKNQMEVIKEEIKKLNESELLLEREKEKLQYLFDIELLFDTLSEGIKSSSGIYIKN